MIAGFLRRLAIAAYVGASLCALSMRAGAGNDDENPIGNQAALMAGAVTAIVDDGSAVYYNPAGVAATNQQRLNVSGSAYVLRVYQIPALLFSTRGHSATGSFVEVLSVPSALSFVRPLDARWSLGLGLFVLQASDVFLGTLLRVSRGDGTQDDWNARLAGTTYVYTGGVALGYRATSTARLGLSILGAYRSAYGSEHIAGGNRDPLTGSSELFFGRMRLFANRQLGVRAGLGVQWDATDRLKLGFSLLTPAFRVYSNTRDITTLWSAAAAGGQNGHFESFEIESSARALAVILPHRMRAGATYRFDELLLAVDADVQGPLQNRALDIQRDTLLNARVALRWTLSDRLELGAGLFTDRSPSPTPAAFAARSIDYYGVTAGVELEDVLGVLAQGRGSAIGLSWTTAVRYAYGAGPLGGVVVAPITSGDASWGIVESPIRVHELSLYIGSGLRF